MSDNELKELKASTNIVEVISKFTTLKRKGKLYEGLCPFHSDSSIGSFKVDGNKGTYRCYACGASGDVISFITGMGNTFKKAVDMLKGKEAIAGEFIEQNTVERIALAEFSYIKPLTEIDPKNFIHGKFGKPAYTYTYFDKDNSLAGYVLRYEQNSEKFIFPYNYGICVKAGWQYEYNNQGSGAYYEIGDIVHKYLGFGDNKPIYGVEKLKLFPKANVVICEGEKGVDYLQSLFDPKQVSFITFQGGTNNVDKCDWSVLEGRRCFLLEDNDLASQKAFSWLANHIINTASEINRVSLNDPFSEPKGWDIVDRKVNANEFVSYLQENKKEFYL